MGWRTDWLYGLIFHEVQRVWRRAIREGRGKFGPAPSQLLIKEMSDADWELMRSKGRELRKWCYSGGTPEPLPVEDETTESLGEQVGMFYEKGDVRFFIASDRKRVLLTYTLGPRYGRGMAFAIEGQGAKGRLVPTGGPGWVS